MKQLLLVTSCDSPAGIGASLRTSDAIQTGSGPEKVRVVLETGNPGNSDQSPVPS